MKNDYKRNNFLINHKEQKQYFLKVKGKWIEVDKQVYLICKESYQKMYREIIRDYNVLIYYESVDDIQPYAINYEEIDMIRETMLIENIKVLQEAIKKLTPNEQLLIHDLYYEELSYRQISKKYNVPVSTLQYLIKKIVNKLRKYFVQK